MNLDEETGGTDYCNAYFSSDNSEKAPDDN